MCYQLYQQGHQLKEDEWGMQHARDRERERDERNAHGVLTATPEAKDHSEGVGVSDMIR